MPTEVLNSQQGANDHGPKGHPSAPTAPAEPEDAVDDEIWRRDVWTKPDGSVEVVIELEQEPRHHVSLVNDFTKIITIRMDPNDTTLAHRHQARGRVAIFTEIALLQCT